VDFIIFERNELDISFGQNIQIPKTLPWVYIFNTLCFGILKIINNDYFIQNTNIKLPSNTIHVFQTKPLLFIVIRRLLFKTYIMF